MFYGSAPFFIVKNLQQSVDYYCDVLGFERPFMWKSQPPFAMPQREGFIIMLEQATDNSVRNNQGKWDAYFWVKDVKTLFKEFREKGAKIHYELEYRPFYGNLEFAIKDPDDYILAFAQEIENDSLIDDKQQAKFLHMIPVLASSDVSRDIEWYANKLGFKNVYDSTAYQDGPIDYAVLRRQDLLIHLQFQFPKDMTSTDVKIEVENIDLLIEGFIKKGLITEEKVTRKTPWNTDEFGLYDPSGNRITFLEDL
jgi:uncharacterized glyoxalase superfamily protein PhnB